MISYRIIDLTNVQVCSKNSSLLSILVAVTKITLIRFDSAIKRIYLGYRPENLVDERIKAAIKEHRAILIALEKRNVDAAIEWTRKHIKSGMDYILNSINTEEEIYKEYDYISGIVI